MVLIPNFVRGGYNRSANAPASIMSLDTTPLLEQLNELRTLVYKYVRKDGNHPPPPYVPPQPSAPETDKQLFLENILQEPPQPKATSRLYPDISVRNRFKLIKEYLVKKSTNPKGTPDSQSREQPNPDLNVDGSVSSDPWGITASSIMTEEPTDLIGGLQHAPIPYWYHRGPTHPTVPPPPPPQPAVYRRPKVYGYGCRRCMWQKAEFLAIGQIIAELEKFYKSDILFEKK